MSKYAGPWRVMVRQNGWFWECEVFEDQRRHYWDRAWSRKGALRHAKYEIERTTRQRADEANWREVGIREVWEA